MSDIRASLYAKTDGFIKGVCHPTGDFDAITDLGFGWIRRDVPYPFNDDGSVNEYYLGFLEETRTYKNHGLRSVIVSPYPRTFLTHGIDPRTPDGLDRVREVCAYIARDYRDLGVCWQATNEMFVIGFRMPLTAPESVEFLVASLLGLREGDPDAALGHNSVTLSDGWDEFCRDIDSRTDCDYFGLDLYIGSWENGTLDTYTRRIDELYELCKKPIILMEFGFASRGGNLSADRHEELEFLREHGFADIEDVKRRPQDFMKLLPPPLLRTAEGCAAEDLVPALLGMMSHLTKLWYTDMLFPHTEEGQAEFYAALLPKLLANEHLAGTILYCWRDSPICFTCGSADCPCETAWGLTRYDDSPKPVCEVLRQILSGRLNRRT